MMRYMILIFLFLVLAAQTPKVTQSGAELPNGWKLTPVGRHTATADYVLNVQQAPDGKALVGLHSGFNPHGLAVVDPVTVHDLHATLLHLLGMDHLRLTFPHNGRDFRLTDVAGQVLHPLLT